MKIGWFSFGVSSFISCFIERKTIDRYIAIYVPDQHEDSMRFLHDCEKVLGKEIEIIQSEKYHSLTQVIEETGCMNTVYGAPCCRLLKKDVRKSWELKNPGRHTYVWGYDVSEKNRADRIAQELSHHDHVFPLIRAGLTKRDCHGILSRMHLGPERPKLYNLGFPNNNCIGCVKQGQNSWILCRKYFPEVFQERVRQERMIGHSCMNGMYLDELPEEQTRDLSVYAETQKTFFETIHLSD